MVAALCLFWMMFLKDTFLESNLSRRHFGLLITKVCHLGMWSVNMHQIS